MYAGGSFSTAAYLTVHSIAKWNGYSWSTLGFGMDNTVLALAVSGSDLYEGGDFTKAGGSPANAAAKWNGLNWTALGSGIGGTDMNSVYALAVSGTTVCARGLFTMAGNVGASSIARWDGYSWTAPDYLRGATYSHPEVQALAMSGSNVCAGGRFHDVRQRVQSDCQMERKQLGLAGFGNERPCESTSRIWQRPVCGRQFYDRG